MTRDEFENLFDKYEAEFRKFENIELKLSPRPDLHAFLMLHSFDQSGSDIIVGAEHDQIYLSSNIDEVIKTIKEDQVIDLIRCGVWYNGDSECLSMFV